MKIQLIHKERRCLIPFLAIILLLSITTIRAQEKILNTQQLDSLQQGLVKVAFGEQSYNSVTAAISTIYATDLTKRVTPMVGNALVGRLPGLFVRQSSGAPGSVPTLTIRGQNTFNAATPLVIVDGFRAEYNQLSLYEIESVSVLKDASATVLYGMDAANGVLLVTTKRGKIGGMKVDFNYNYGIQQPTQLPTLLNATGYATYYNQARLNDRLPVKYDPVSDIPFYGKGGNYTFTHPDNNFVKDFLLNSAPVMTGGLNISGGNEKSRYMVSLGYIANEGILNFSNLNSYSTQARMDKVNVRTNLDVNVLKGLTASIDVAVSFDNRNYPGYGIDGIISTLLQTPPQEYVVKNPNGSLGGTATFKDNPLGMISQSGYQTSLQRNLDVNLRLEYAFDNALKGLKLGAAGSSTTWMVLWDNKTRSFATYSMDDPSNLASTTYTQHGDSTNLVWGSDVVTYKRMTFEANATYSRTFGAHKVDGLLMYHMDRYVQQISSSNPYNYDNGGLGLRLAYSNNNKYFAEFAGSYYGQEQYNPANRFRFFPTGSMAWIASKEDFLSENDKIDYLKLRASYGIVGGGSGQLFPGYNAKTRMNYAQYYQKFGGVNFGETNSFAPASASYQLGPLANPYLSADLSHKFNVGFESTLINHINVKFDYFYDKRTDILAWNNMMPATMGFAGRLSYLNGGQVNNQGYELSVDFFGEQGEFSYLINGGLWYSKSKMVKKPDVIPLPGVDNRSGINMPIGQNFGYEVIGFYATDADAANATVKQTFGYTQAGDAIYKDNTGDNRIDISDMVPLGFTYNPQYEFALSIDLKYKGVYLSALGQGTLNSSVMLGGYAVPFSTQGNAYKTFTENSWTPATAATAKYPRLSTTANANNSQPSSIWLVSTDYLKLRNLEIGYELPKAWLNELKFKSARVYLLGLDLFTVAKEYKHGDPETLGIYPSMKSYSLGISLTF